MTKYKLIKALEPFEDDIEIVLLKEENYKFYPNIYYHMTGDGSGQIILGNMRPPFTKVVELKV